MEAIAKNREKMIEALVVAHKADLNVKSKVFLT
jgi:hypothetical protein